MSKLEEKRFIDSIMYMLRAPILTFPRYEDMITTENRIRVELERMKKLDVIMQTKQATDFEVVLYLSTCSYIAPLPRAFAKIFQHCFIKYFDWHDIYDSESDRDYYCNLFEEEQYDLAKLKAWIFKRQMEAMK